MDVSDALKIRKSCRKYIDKKINAEDIDKILWAGSRAPYGSGGPRREFFHTSDRAVKEKLKLACHKQKYVLECSTVVVICGLEEKVVLRSGYPKYIHDCDAAAMSMILQAVELGLDNCWIGHFKPDEVKQIMNIESRPVVLLLLGYKGEKNERIN